MNSHARLRSFLGCLILLYGLCTVSAEQGNAPEADRLEQQGRFKDAAALLDQSISNEPTNSPHLHLLEFERDRLDRIRKDFPFTKEELFRELQKSVKGLTSSEFEQWISEGRFDSRNIDGTRRFMVSSVSNLFWRYPELSPRRTPPKNTAALERKVLESCQTIKTAAVSERKPYVLPKRFEATMRVSVTSNAAPVGETIRAWLPIPREYPFQGRFELLQAIPSARHIDEPQSPIRSLMLESTTEKDRPTTFELRYAYVAHGVRFDVDPKLVETPDPRSKPELHPFVSEGPHIKFTPEMRALSEEIAGSETNCYLKAKKFYDWIAENIKYSYAIEYSTIRNIGEYCRDRGYGDCGQEALLFMTLCRLNGIPARWQSGWNTFPGAKSIHDWSEIYVAPYGWIPVDPYMGIFAMRYATSLRPSQRLEIRDFYFGGLDQYRMIANSDHSQSLSPPKKAFRSDTVDFQRGELEWGDHNIYLDQFSYSLEVKETKTPTRVE